MLCNIFMQEARQLKIHRTVHAGEAGPAASVKEVRHYRKFLGLQLQFYANTKRKKATRPLEILCSLVSPDLSHEKLSDRAIFV